MNLEINVQFRIDLDLGEKAKRQAIRGTFSNSRKNRGDLDEACCTLL